jgi:CP family cyanate transporter-like MFS transporter
MVHATVRIREAWPVAAIVLLGFNLRTAVTAVPPVLPDLGLTRAGETALTALPLILFGLAALAAPLLRRRLGIERGLFAAASILLAGVLLRSAGEDTGLFAGTVAACVGIAAMNVLMPSFTAKRFPERAGLMTGLYTMALSVGAAAAAGLTVPLRDASGSTSLALGIWSVPVLAALAVLTPLLRSRDDERVEPQATRLTALWRQPLAWWVTLFMGLQAATFYAPLSWLPTMYRDEGFEPATAGLLLAIFTGVGMASNLAAPVLAHRMRDQRPAIVAAMALSIGGGLGLLLAPSAAPALWASLMGLGQGAALSLALLVIVLRSPAPETAARLSAMAQGAGYLLAATGPAAMAVLHGLSGGWTVPLLGLLAAFAIQLAAGLAAARPVLLRA